MLAAVEAYDVIILDRMLPELGGLAILRTIRASGVMTLVLLPSLTWRYGRPPLG